MSQDDPRLTRLLGGDELANLRKQLRRRFEREDLDNPISEIRLTGLDPHERNALTEITGNRGSSASMALDLATLDATFADAGIAPSLRAALEQIDGPIVHAASANAAEVARWNTVTDSVAHPSLSNWLASPGNLGLVKRLSTRDHVKAELLCQAAARVLSHLPTAGMTLAHLAAQTLADAHGLDASEPVSTIVVSVLRNDNLSSDEPSVPEDDRLRSVWARSGVMVNELAKPALLLNLPFEVADQSATASPGEPSFASLRWLLRSHPSWRLAGVEVFVCENPNVVAVAADRLGARCAPLVCTDGMPAAAQRVLLTQLKAAGATLRYHGDFDWPGIRIANLVFREHGASPWRMNCADFTQASNLVGGQGKRLSGSEVDASWDHSLRTLMRAHGRGIPEESLIDVLLADL